MSNNDSLISKELSNGELSELANFSDFTSGWTMSENSNQYLLEEGLEEFFLHSMGGVRRLKSYAKPVHLVEGIPSIEGSQIVETFRQQIWFTPLMIVLTFTIGMLFVNRFKIYKQELRFFFLSGRGDTSVSDNRMGLFQFRFLTFSVSIISITLFCSFVLEDILNYQPDSFSKTFIRLLGVVLLYILVKMVITRILCFVFLDNRILVNLKQLYTTLLTMLGFSLFISVLLISYGQSFIIDMAFWMGIIVCCLSVGLYLYKIFDFFFTGVSSLFYLILYLCTLEILPTAIFVWVLMISV